MLQGMHTLCVHAKVRGHPQVSVFTFSSCLGQGPFAISCDIHQASQPTSFQRFSSFPVPFHLSVQLCLCLGDQNLGCHACTASILIAE